VLKTHQQGYMFLSNLNVKEAQSYYQLILNILCVTLFVTSSITVLQALLLKKLSVYDQIVIKNL